MLIDFLLNFLVSAYIDMINMSEKFQEIVGAEVREKKAAQNSVVKLFQKFQK